MHLGMKKRLWSHGGVVSQQRLRTLWMHSNLCQLEAPWKKQKYLKKLIKKSEKVWTNHADLSERWFYLVQRTPDHCITGWILDCFVLSPIESLIYCVLGCLIERLADWLDIWLIIALIVYLIQWLKANRSKLFAVFLLYFIRHKIGWFLYLSPSFKGFIFNYF